MTVVSTSNEVTSNSVMCSDVVLEHILVVPL